MMIRKIILLTFLWILNMSYINAQIDSPLVTVVKLQSAESMANLEEAKNYIDLKRVYPKSKFPEEDWENMINFFYNLGQDKKFTNCFKYYLFQIKEEINFQMSTVSFLSKDSKSSIQKIIYTLELHQQKWIIIAVDYIK